MDIWNVSVIYFAALTRCPNSDVEISRAICTRCNSRSCNLELRAGLKLKFDINASVSLLFLAPEDSQDSRTRSKTSRGKKRGGNFFNRRVNSSKLVRCAFYLSNGKD